MTTDGQQHQDFGSVRQALSQFFDLGGDPFVAEMIDLLNQQTPKQLKEIEASLMSGNFTTAQRHAHSMKSTFGSFGAARCQELATRMDLAAKNGDVDAFRRDFAILRNEFDTLQALLPLARQP